MFRQPYRGSGNYSTSMDIKNAFQEGAEWADKTMIEKACEWIEDNVENAFVFVNDTMTELNGIELSRYIRKAMEE